MGDQAAAWRGRGALCLFNTQPDKLKARGDWAMCQGINHYVLHVYLHQPDDRKPGITAWFGTDFNRNNTWFSRAKSWATRCCSGTYKKHKRICFGFKV